MPKWIPNPEHPESSKMASLFAQAHSELKEKHAFAEMLAEFEKIATELNIGQWWEQIGGPFLAKGGDHGTFKKMMDEAGIPTAKQERFMRSAKERYPSGFGAPSSRGGSRPSNGASSSSYAHNRARWQDPGSWEDYKKKVNEDTARSLGIDRLGLGAAAVGAAAGIGATGYMLFSPKKTEEVEAPNRLSGHIGALASTALPTAAMGYSVGAINGSPKARLLGALAGAVLGGGLGELLFRQREEGTDRIARRALKGDERSEKKVEDLAKLTSAGWARKGAVVNALHGGLRSVFLGNAPLHVGASLAGTLGGGAAEKYYHGLTHQKVQEGKKLKEKAAFDTSQYSTPIEGPKVARQESAQPGFRAPGMLHPLQKVSFQQSQYGDTGGVVDFHQVSSLPGFRKPKLNAPVETKQAGAITPSGLTPKARLSSSMRIGAPKVTSPSGPSIGDIAKPKGFGQKLPGATLSP